MPVRRSGHRASALKDAAEALLNRAANASAHTDDRAVHAVRKDLKRARAALRLLRQTIGNAQYRDANRRLRDAALPLRPLRDATALLDTLRKITKSSGNERIEARRFREHLHKIRDLARGRCTRKSRRLEATRIQLVNNTLQQMAVRATAPVSARRGISKTYKRGRKAFAKAERRTTVAVLHELRKQAKYLANELELASHVLQIDFKKQRHRAHKLAVVLGDDHDLAMLKEKLLEWCASQHSPGGRASQKTLGDRIDSARDKLQAKAHRHAKKLYGRSRHRLHEQLERDLH